MSDSQPLAQQIQELEAYIESLVDSLGRNERPVGLKPVRQIVDSLLLQEIPPLELAATKFIELYNDVPGILSAYAIVVNLNTASYQSRDYQQAVFDRQPQGNYWIIMTSPERGWLVPNPTKNTASLNSLNFAFDLSTLSQTTTDHSHLLVPALVQLLPTIPATWKVTQRGQLGETLSRIATGTDTAALAAEIRTLRQELREAIGSLQAKDVSLEKQLVSFKSSLKDMLIQELQRVMAEIAILKDSVKDLFKIVTK
jgi:hypothetical protein